MDIIIPVRNVVALCESNAVCGRIAKQIEALQIGVAVGITQVDSLAVVTAIQRTLAEIG